MTHSSSSEKDFKAFLEEFESNGEKLQGTSSNPLTSKDEFFPTQEKLTIKERKNATFLEFDWDRHTYEYKTAADILVEHFESEAKHDLQVYPIMFLYRHYLELAIKILIIKSRKYHQNIEPEESIRSFSKNDGHNLVNLWDKFLSISAPEKRTELKQITRLIGELCKLDSGSYAFRYPTNPNGGPSIQCKTKCISITRIRDIIWKICYELERENSYLELLQAQEIEWNDHLNDYFFSLDMLS